MAVSCALGAKRIWSEDCPKASFPGLSASCSGAAESVCWAMMSAPCASRALAASASLPGSNQVFTQTILSLMFGFTDWAPSMKALMPLTTSGIGNEAM